jgi:hypothetical protein
MESFKNKFGEVFSPDCLISQMLDLLPNTLFSDSLLRWLDPGSGQGSFTKHIFNHLNNNLTSQIKSKREREKHIWNNMLHMIEINSISVEKTLYDFDQFSHKPNILCANFLEHDFNDTYDVIIGNPPFNFNGIKKVPTNNIKDKKKDGATIWIEFIKKSLSILNDNGFLCFITPAIWLKPDKQKCYQLLTQYQIHHIFCMTNTETNKLFKGQAQTPTVIFTIQKCPRFKDTLIYDKDINKYVKYNITNNIPIPVYGVSIINKLMPFTQKYGSIKKYIHKSNPLTKNIKTIANDDGFSNISTCVLTNNHPTIVITHTDKPCPYHDTPKVVLAHKMYGFPYFDKKGEYGISTRDNYIILHDDMDILDKFFDFFNNHFAIYLFETTRYRMKYLEKYVFEFIPDISNIPDFPQTINQDTILEYFGFDDNEISYILNMHKNKYSFFDKN